ncbi:hypothetical protein CAPTEDRAFT_212152 [Capitella teleta]|uniref:Leucine-rich repeat and coiled-coil domain-containing protein 1 n=1 Tax=Capitella teleta TaxID=283909 RepID=R7UQH8_CAPTE|nr:hypothetical protein CAPTEDRAFT_212152 [Capitella teleta]|eukprot:ELU06182.1 hypothetical protein CAPTEDRAFT_212152 [Capitella teleta]
MAAAYTGREDLDDNQELCLFDAGIQSIRDVPLSSNLQVLNLHCNGIRVIENLGQLHHLKHLDLSSNQITSIEGLDSLVSLRSLNLACNRIQRVQGLSNIRCLVKLNLSYNQISDMTGFQVMQGNDFALLHVELHGNQLQSVPHVCRCIRGCVNLRHLVFSQSGASNPICHQHDYRSSILTALPSLTVLDGINRRGQEVTPDEVVTDIPGFEQYMDYLLTSSSSDMQPIRRAFPRIEAAMEAYRQRGVTTPEISTVSEYDTSQSSPACKSYPKKVVNSEIHEKRLEKLEQQLANLLLTKGSVSQRSKVNGKPLLKAKRDVDDTEESEEEKNAKLKAKPLTMRNRRPVKKTDKKTDANKQSCLRVKSKIGMNYPREQSPFLRCPFEDSMTSTGCPREEKKDGFICESI